MGHRHPRIFEALATAPALVRTCDPGNAAYFAERNRIAGEMIRNRKVEVVIADGLDVGAIGKTLPDLGVCRPPFPQMWVEFKSGEPEARGDSWGMFCHSEVLATGRISYLFDVFWMRDGVCYGTLAAPHGEMEADGTFSADGLLQMFPSPLFKKMYPCELHAQRVGTQFAIDFFYICSMMHCRNVSVISAGYTDDEDTARDRRIGHRWGRGHIEYKVLKVTVGGKSVVLGRGASGESRDLPLHTVRGHFNTYTAERPLFGRHVGRFWIPSHLRGAEEAGEVCKTYEIADSIGTTP